MDETVDLRVLPEHFIETLLVSDVDIVVCWPFPTDALDPIQNFFGGVVEVVDNDHFIIGFQKGKNSQGANVASTTKYLSAYPSVRAEVSIPSDQAVSSCHCEVRE